MEEIDKRACTRVEGVTSDEMDIPNCSIANDVQYEQTVHGGQYDTPPGIFARNRLPETPQSMSTQEPGPDEQTYSPSEVDGEMQFNTQQRIARMQTAARENNYKRNQGSVSSSIIRPAP